MESKVDSKMYGSVRTSVKPLVSIFHESFTPINIEDTNRVNVTVGSKKNATKVSENFVFSIKNMKDTIELFINKNIKNVGITNIYSYEEDPDYIYISINNEDKSIEENFENVEKLNNLAIEHDLNYIFIVG